MGGSVLVPVGSGGSARTGDADLRNGTTPLSQQVRYCGQAALSSQGVVQTW